jgi:hypothetical protein
MKVNYSFTLCLFKVGRLFCKLAIPKYICVFVIKLSIYVRVNMENRTYNVLSFTHMSVCVRFCILFPQ